MPLKGFVCPSTVPTAGSRNSVDHCMRGCPHPCIAPPLIRAIYDADAGNYHKGTYISASMLTGGSCARQVWFERTVDFFEEPKRRYWAFRGTHAHSIIERSAKPLKKLGWLQELRVKAELEYEDGLKVVVAGAIDAYNPSAPPFPLWDFKSMADSKAEKMITGAKWPSDPEPRWSKNVDDKWVLQLNIYRWLVAMNGYPVPEFLGIQGIAMLQVPRTGSEYMLKLPRRDAERYQIDDVPLLPLPEVETFVREEARKWHGWLVEGLKPPVVGKRLDWLCKSCAFNGDIIPGERCRPSQERSGDGDLELV